jgi:hypothetical protein
METGEIFDVEESKAIQVAPPAPFPLAKRELGADIEQVLIEGDLRKLTPEQRLRYVHNICEVMGMNIATRPLDYINLGGKLVLYANKNAAEQLRRVHGVSIFKLERDGGVDTYDVTAYARNADGREDAALGSVSIKGLGGEALSNAKMKAETKAKRRVTLSLCGLGMLDETEVDTIPGATKVAPEKAEAASAPVPEPPAPPEASQAPPKRRGRPPGAPNKPKEPVQQALPVEPDPQAEPVMNPNQRFIDACAKEAERLGKAMYMEALGAYGYEKTEEIVGRDKQMTFYKTLQSLNPV